MADRAESESPRGATETTAGTARRLFISYASQDAEVAQETCSALESVGFLCWMAPRDVKPGAQYADAIVRAINEAQVVVLVLSASAIASSHVGREVERAASKRKQIITFRLDGAPLNPALEYFLGESQWIDVSALGMRAALAKLTEAVGQESVTSTQANPVGKRFVDATRIGKPLIVAAAAVIGVGALVALGLHIWRSSRGAAQAPAVAASNGLQANTTPAAISDKSIAVMPFADMSENKDQEYFADGMAEEILDLLAKIPELSVIGRTSSFQFKGKSEDLRTIGARLGAAFVVEGSVRRSGPRIRVTAQLVDARSGAHRWSESYDRDFGDILTLQDEIAAGIARALQLSIDADESATQRQLPNAQAYALYLRGLLAQDQQSFEKLYEAVRDFEQALALNPAFLRAAEALARTHVDQGFDEAVLSRDAWQSAREAAQRALRIDAKSATAHAVLGLVHAEVEFDWNAAETEINQALALNPRDSAALCYAAIIAGARGLKPQSQRLFSASLAVDPLNPYTQQHFGQMLVAAGDFAGAEVALRKSIAINASFDGNHYQLSKIDLARDEFQAAFKEIQQEVTSDAKNAGLAMVYYALRRKGDSDATLSSLIRESGDTWPYSVATVYAYRGERNEAFKWLEKGLASRDSDQLEGIRGDPEFAALREDARYRALLRRMNLLE
ncbi:MAG: TIR domain-containing protein [Steroidobacteraceae bacterium]